MSGPADSQPFGGEFPPDKGVLESRPGILGCVGSYVNWPQAADSCGQPRSRFPVRGVIVANLHIYKSAYLHSVCIMYDITTYNVQLCNVLRMCAMYELYMSGTYIASTKVPRTAQVSTKGLGRFERLSRIPSGYTLLHSLIHWLHSWIQLCPAVVRRHGAFAFFREQGIGGTNRMGDDYVHMFWNSRPLLLCTGGKDS